MLKINPPRGAASKRKPTAAKGTRKGGSLLKSYNGLMAKVLDRTEAVAAIEEAAKYKRHRPTVMRILENKEAKAEELHRIAAALAAFLRKNLHLSLKGDWQVFRFEKQSPRADKASGRAINALGYVIHRNRVGVRKTSLQRVRRKANRIYAKGRCTLHDAQSMVSRAGLLRHANAYHYYEKHIKPRVNIRYCKRKISAHMKKQKGAKAA